MFLNFRMIPAITFSLPYDDAEVVETQETETEETSEDTLETPVVEEKPKKKPAAKVKLDSATQDYVNSLLAEERRKGQTKNGELIKQLETQKNRAGTTQAEKERLEIRIEELKAEYATKEELANRTTSKKIKDLTTRVTQAEADSKKWQSMFQGYRINNSLLQAASEAKAYNPSQVVALLAPNTRLVEATDAEGNVIPDQWLEKVKLNGKDKDGKPLVLDLPVTEAVKQLSEMPEYGNLFISGATGGIGGNNLSTRGGGSGDTPPKDTANYMAWRADRKKKGLPV